jgi:2-methylfumaryl-CoA hydratase
MVRKRDPHSEPGEVWVPDLPESIAAHALHVPEEIDFRAFDSSLSGSRFFWEDYEPEEKIDHIDGMTVEESDHMLATRLYQNTARVHFNQHAQNQESHGRRLIYGGHAISIARALSFNGLGNALLLAGINAGRHVNPLFAGDTVFAWSHIVDKAELPGRSDCGALRLRLMATRNLSCGGFPDKDAAGRYPDDLILDFDYWAILPRHP